MVRRSFEYLQGDYHIAPAFLHKVVKVFKSRPRYRLHFKGNGQILVQYVANDIIAIAVCHIVMNCISHLINAKVPLLLGVWGGKGQGNTFQTELIFREMGIEPVIMSAGELESERAEPGRLIRERYRTASKVVQNQARYFDSFTAMNL